MPDSGTTKLPAPFGKYLLTNLIAVGGMAEVYRAKIFGASGFEKEMVVKRILPRYAQNPNFVQMLIDEAKLVSSINRHAINCPHRMHRIATGSLERREIVLSHEAADGFLHGLDIQSIVHMPGVF